MTGEEHINNLHIRKNSNSILNPSSKLSLAFQNAANNNFKNRNEIDKEQDKIQKEVELKLPNISQEKSNVGIELLNMIDQ